MAVADAATKVRTDLREFQMRSLPLLIVALTSLLLPISARSQEAIRFGGVRGVLAYASTEVVAIDSALRLTMDAAGTRVLSLVQAPETERYRHCAFSANGRFLLRASSELSVVDLAGDQSSRWIDSGLEPVALALGPTGSDIFVGTVSGRILSLSSDGWKLECATSTGDPITAMAVSPDGDFIVTCGREVRVRRAVDLELVASLLPTERRADGVAVESPARITTITRGGYLCEWDESWSEQPLGFDAQHFEFVSRGHCAFASLGGQIRLWNASSRRQVDAITIDPETAGVVRAIRWSESAGELLVTTSRGLILRLSIQ